MPYVHEVDPVLKIYGVTGFLEPSPVPQQALITPIPSEAFLIPRVADLDQSVSIQLYRVKDSEDMAEWHTNSI